MDMSVLHQKQKATQMIIRELRKVLRERDKYHGSLLEQMDLYSVKISELSENETVLRPGIQVARPLIDSIAQKRVPGKRTVKKNRKYN